LVKEALPSCLVAERGPPGREEARKSKADRKAGAPVGSRHRQQLNGEFIAALLRDFRQGGPKAIERVRRTQPAAYLKILALLMPREHKVEHRNLLKEMTDEELEAAIEFIQKMLATQAEKAKVIDGTTEATVLPAPAEFEQPRRKRRNRLLEHVDTAIGPSRKPQ
jgi:pyruvate-formate lyase-activating enzyme